MTTFLEDPFLSALLSNTTPTSPSPSQTEGSTAISPAAFDLNVSPVGRADTESGLRFTTAGRTNVTRAATPNNPGQMSESPAAEPRSASLSYFWTDVSILLALYASIRVFLGLRVSRVGGVLLLGIGILLYSTSWLFMAFNASGRFFRASATP